MANLFLLDSSMANIGIQVDVAMPANEEVDRYQRKSVPPGPISSVVVDCGRSRLSVRARTGG